MLQLDANQLLPLHSLQLDAELIESDSDEDYDDDNHAGLSEEQRSIKIAEKQR
jgi:hypothetical protein